HLTHTERDFRSFCNHLDLGTGTHRTLAAPDFMFLAIANNNGGLLLGRRGSDTLPATSNYAYWRSGYYALRTRSVTGRSTTDAAESAATTAAGPHIQASYITRAHRGVPGGMNVTAVISGDGVVLTVVKQNIGVRDATHRSVQIVDRQ